MPEWAASAALVTFPCRIPALLAPTACMAAFADDTAKTCAQYFVLMEKRPGAPTTLGQLLDNNYDIRPFGGLVLAWVPFGSSGHIHRLKVRLDLRGTLHQHLRGVQFSTGNQDMGAADIRPFLLAALPPPARSPT